MTSTPDYHDEPCPQGILDDIGRFFSIGFFCGGTFHFIKGWRHSTDGQRILDSLTAVRRNAPRIGGRCAAWAGLCSVFGCTMVHLCHKEGSWNFIMSGAVASGLLSVRQGAGRVSKMAVFGGCLCALFEGADIMLTRFDTPEQLPQVNYDNGAPLAQGRAEVGTTPSWFDGTDKEILESFDSPVPPIVDFKSS